MQIDKWMYPLKRANNTTMQTTKTASTKIPAYATKIAKEVLNLETLETRNSDCLDFYDMAVWDIRKALEAAYNAGREAASK